VDRPNKSHVKGVFRGDEGGTLNISKKFFRFDFSS